MSNRDDPKSDSPGASGPGEPGYEGRAPIGDEGGAMEPPAGETPAEAVAEATEGEAPTG